MMSLLNRLFYSIYYLSSPSWDTGIPAPELVRTIANRPPGRAIDIGCGTGTNLLYLAEHGWQVTGVDFIPRAIAKAQKKLKAYPVALHTADVTKLETLDMPGPYDLALDMGCLHSLAGDGRAAYARGLAQWMKPGGIYLLYAWQPAFVGDSHGLTREAVVRNFETEFRLSRYEQGTGHPSAWYYFMRK